MFLDRFFLFWKFEVLWTFKVFNFDELELREFLEFFKNKTYLYYAFAALGMALNAFYKDGLTAYIFGSEGINEYLEPILDSILYIGGVTFINSFLKLKRRYPKYFYSAIIIFWCVSHKNFYFSG